MKKSFLKRIVSLVFIGVALHSCVNELEQINPNALTNESFWKTTGDLNAGLNAAYAALRNENIMGIMFENQRTDIGVSGNFRNNTEGNPIYDQSFDLTTDEVQDKWDACFLGIFRANQVLDAYNDLKATLFSGSTSSQEAGLRIEAQARAIRGYLYYVLHSSYNYGSLPIHETVPTNFEDFQKSFSSSAEVKAFYRADLQFGIENLPATYNAWQSDVGPGNLGRITGGFCEALMAKSYMNENDFTNAEVYLNNVMTNYGYRLVDDLEKCFTGIDEFNDESIFEINYSTDTNLLGTNEQSLAHSISHNLNNNRLQPATWLILKYREEKPDPLDPANYLDRNRYSTSDGSVIGVDTNVLRLYSKRMGNSMSQINDPDSPMYGVTAGVWGIDPDASPHARQNPAFFKKFTHWNIPNGGKGEDESTEYRNKSGINLPIIRLAEIYLLYAECMIEKGDLTEALKYINRVRKRSHLILLGPSASGEFPTATTTYSTDIDFNSANGVQPVTLQSLKDHLRYVEKPLELALEGERQIDLRRWGVWKERLQYIASFEYDTYGYFQNQNGDNRTRFRCFAVPAGTPQSAIPFRVQGTRKLEPHLKDQLVGSQNFVESLHSYFPVPQDEINANLNWNQ